MAAQGGVAMSDLIWLSEAQMRRIEPYFPLSHGVPRVDDRRVLSGIVFVIRNGLRWRDAPAAIARYIDGFDNPIRQRSALDYLSPVQFEKWAAR